MKLKICINISLEAYWLNRLQGSLKQKRSRGGNMKPDLHIHTITTKSDAKFELI